MDTCPPLEEIAAFLDDVLSPEDRERITAHLTSCESCYEVFAGAVQFQEDEADIEEDVDLGPFVKDSDRTGVSLLAMREAAPFPFTDGTDGIGVSRPSVSAREKVRPRTARWLALAASVLLVSVLGFVAWKLLASPKIVLADVVRPLEQEEEISGLLYGGATRGDSPEGDLRSTRPSFMAGVYLLDLRLSLQAGNLEQTKFFLHGLYLSLKEIPYLEEDQAARYLEESQRMETPSDGARLTSDLPAREAEIEEVFSDYEGFPFGLWAEAGRLSALTESPDFFDSRKNRRFLSRLLKEETLPVPPELQEDVLENLQAVRSAWDLSPRNYKLIADHLQSIIHSIDSYEEEDFSNES